MNHFHRVIFNRALGMRQVVSEIASSGRGTGTTSTVSNSGLCQIPRLTRLAGACLLAWCAVSGAHAATHHVIDADALRVTLLTKVNDGDTVILDADINNYDSSDVDNITVSFTLNGNGHSLDGSGRIYTAAGTMTILGFLSNHVTVSAYGGTISTDAGSNLDTILPLIGGTLQNTAAFTYGGTVVARPATFQTDADLGIAGVIIDTGHVTKTGASTLTFTGTNTYTGGTTISAGTLQLGDGGTSGSIVGDVTDNGTLVFNRSNAVSFSGAISGSGTLQQVGTGTTTLTGANTYTGGTTITAGTLQLGDGGTSGSIQGDVVNNGTLAFNRSDAVSFDGVISGSGALQQVGTGTTTLTGINTYSGGTNLNAGTLSVSADNNLGNAAGALTFNGGTLQNTAALTTTRAITLNAGGGTFQTDADLSAAGAIGGTGSLTKTGGGTLTLSGNNNYGSTTLSAGTLQVGNGGTSGSLGTGAVTNNASLVFNRSDDITAANDIGGTGTLTQAGSGTVTLSGANTYSGGTNLDSGTLSVSADNDLGNAAGTLTFNGGALQTTAAFSTARAITLNAGGGTIQTDAILTSTGATTGAFTGVTSNLAFLTPSLSYLPNGVTLNLLADTAPVYSTVAQTPNQTSIANYLSSFANTPGNPAAAALIQQIDNLSADQARVAFDSMSGNPHAAASQVALAMGRSFSATLAARTGFALGSGTPASSTAGLKAIKFASVSPALLTRQGDVVSDSPLVAMADAPGASSGFETRSAGGLWGQAMGTGGRTGSDGSGPASRYRANGFVFGYDQPLSAEWLAGAALAYNKAQWDATTNGIAPASGSVSTPQAGLYARYTAGPWQVRLDGTYSDHRFSTDRTVTIGNATSIARSSHGGTEWAFAAQAEYSLPAGDWDIRPLAGLRHARLSEDGFTETGAGAASLTVDARRTQNTVASLGMKFIRPLNQSNADKGTLELRAVASHLMGDNNSPIIARLAGQPASFTASGTPLKRTALTLGGTLTGQLSRGLSAYADAAYEYRGAGQNAFQLVAGLKLAW